MDTVFRADERINTLYKEEDLTAIIGQQKKRWLILLIPCAVMAAILVYALIVRSEVLANAATIAAGVVLIAGYDLFIKPVSCYRKHLRNVLHGRVREAELPFVALSEDVSVVDGVSYRALTCADFDAKGRPYDRLFYFDSEKTFPDVKEGDMLRIVHHDLTVSDDERV